MEYRTNKVSFFASFYDAASDLEDKERLAFYDACFKYAFEGVEPSFKGVMNTIWKLVKPNIDSSIKGQQTGGKGGRPKTSKPSLSEGKNPPLCKDETPCETNMDMDKDGDMDKEEGEFVPLERTNSPSLSASSVGAVAVRTAPPAEEEDESKSPHCPMCDSLLRMVFVDGKMSWVCDCIGAIKDESVVWR